MTIGGHRCYAFGCLAPVPEHHLLCRTHWNMCGPDIQKAITENYHIRPDGSVDLNKDFLIAAVAACVGCGVKEGRFARPEAIAAWRRFVQWVKSATAEELYERYTRGEVEP